MHMDQERIRCAFIRGGTSRGAYLLEKDLPRDPQLRDQVILAICGSLGLARSMGSVGPAA